MLELSSRCIRKWEWREDTNRQTIIHNRLVDVDEVFLNHIIGDILYYSNDKTPLENLDAFLEVVERFGFRNDEQLTDPWYNSFPCGWKTDRLHSRFLGISRKGNVRDFDEVLKASLDYSNAVKEVINSWPEKERTVVILTDRWDPKIFKKHAGRYLYYSIACGIRYIFLLVDDFGLAEIPFMGGIEKSMKYSDCLIEIKEHYRAGGWGRSIKQLYVFDLSKGIWVHETDSGVDTNALEDSQIDAIGKFLCEMNALGLIQKRGVDSIAESPFAFDMIETDTELKIFSNHVSWNNTMIHGSKGSFFIRADKAVKKLVSSIDPSGELH